MRLGSVKVGDRPLPDNCAARMLVNFYGPNQTIPTYSMLDVVEGKVPAGTFKDKIVFVGVTLTAVQDLFKSAFSLYLPGVERHATITQRILEGPALVEPDYMGLVNLVALIVLGLLTAGFTARMPASGGITGAVILILVWWGVGQLARFPGGVRLNFVYPALAVLLNFIAMTVLRVVREEKQRRAAERSLRISEERYALAARGANDGLWDWDLATSRFYTSPRWHSMLGIAAEETRNTPEDWYNRTHAEDVTTLQAAIDAHLAGQTAHFEQEFRMRHADQSDRRKQARGLAVVDKLGTPYAVMSRLIEISDREFEMTASIGYVLASQSVGESGDELLRDANLALYKAKTTGRNKAEPFEAAMHATAGKRFDLEADLRRASAKGGELELFYLPIIDIQNDRMHGYEALIRWRHPTRGLVSPIDFIPLAEATGLIVEIGRRSILEAARQIAAWTPPGGGKPPQVADNVSGRQIAAAGLLDDIENALHITEIPPGSLKVEVTESLVMDNPERTVDLLKRIMAIGCLVSIDDFGTGYSSLSHLHRFPFNTLKIDRSFIIRMTESREGFEIVRVIASMAKVLDRDVVAEGVEEQAQVEELRKLGVEFVQGYVYSKPLPAPEATAFLEKWREKERNRGTDKAAS